MEYIIVKVATFSIFLYPKKRGGVGGTKSKYILMKLGTYYKGIITKIALSLGELIYLAFINTKNAPVCKVVKAISNGFMGNYTILIWKLPLLLRHLDSNFEFITTRPNKRKKKKSWPLWKLNLYVLSWRVKLYIFSLFILFKTYYMDVDIQIFWYKRSFNWYFCWLG